MYVREPVDLIQDMHSCLYCMYSYTVTVTNSSVVSDHDTLGVCGAATLTPSLTEASGLWEPAATHTYILMTEASYSYIYRRTLCLLYNVYPTTCKES